MADHLNKKTPPFWRGLSSDGREPEDSPLIAGESLALRGDALFRLGRLAQNVAAAPYGLDVILAG